MDSARRAVLLALAGVLVLGNIAVLATHDFDTSVAVDHSSAPAVTTTSTTPLPGQQFTDRDGKYTLRVDGSWPHRSDSPIRGIETWELPGAANGFTPNMNAVVENLPSGISLEQYVDASKANLPRAIQGVTIISTTIKQGSSGQRLGFIEYTATPNGIALHLLAVCSVHDRTAAVVTVTSGEAQFAQARAAVDPYLLTLQAK
jgi:hypothetical protein